MIRLSIIIPVFNAEDYISECLESCLLQDIPPDEYEILLVDDCSSDKSIEVAKKSYNTCQKSEKPELRIVSSGGSSPKGAAAARNIGLQVGRGEYIWFIDSDDKINNNTLSTIVTLVNRERLDFLRFGYKLLFDCNHIEEHICNETTVLHGKDLFKRYPQPVAVWSFILKREFLLMHDLFFIEGYMFEDQDFSPKVHFFAERTKMVSASLYYYRQRQGSVMKSSVSRFKVESALAVCESLHAFRESHDDSVMSPLLSNRIAFMFSNALNLNSQCNNPISLIQLKKSSYYPLTGVSGWKYRLLNFSIHISFIICKVRNFLHRFISFNLG